MSSNTIQGDARHLPLRDNSVDLVVTSPPYWKKRRYGCDQEIGQETRVEDYIANLMRSLKECGRVLRPTGSVFINIGDTYEKGSLAGVPFLLESAAHRGGWTVRNRILWAKENGMPDPVKNRLTPRHEYILHLTRKRDYYYDLFGYAQKYGNGTNPGDVWHLKTSNQAGKHLAPFPCELVERAITLACPHEVCASCGAPSRRMVERTCRLDESRPQARRAVELAREHGLTDEHIRAIQATGISDAGKALETQNGTGRNSASVTQLASEAKAALGGYFREFTFAIQETVGWTKCQCPRASEGCATVAGTVLDPFVGSGTTVKVATRMKRHGIGIDVQNYE